MQTLDSHGGLVVQQGVPTPTRVRRIREKVNNGSPGGKHDEGGSVLFFSLLDVSHIRPQGGWSYRTFLLYLRIPLAFP